jgi:hypothetical protein
MPGDASPNLPECLPATQRERIVVLTIIHNGQAFSPSDIYRRFDPEPDPELARLPTLLEGLWAALAPGHSESSRYVLARVSGARQPFLAAWWEDQFNGVAINPEDGLGFAIETLVLCEACPVPEACALRRCCRVDQQAEGVDAKDSPESTQPGIRAVSAQDAIGQSKTDTHHGTPLWHTFAAVDAQAKAEAHYRQHVEVRWATAIFAGEHPSYAILPAWHREQMPAYLRNVYYHQDQNAEWEDIPSLDEVVSGVLDACALAAGLQLQSMHPGIPFTYRLANKVEMTEDVVMHAAYFRSLVEDQGLDDE